MTIKVGVFYSGELRTIRKTISYFKENILLNDNVHVFATLQAPNTDTVIEQEYEQWLRKELGSHLISLVWFYPTNPEWTHLRETLLSKMPIEDTWKHYLRTSGSMIEHYQTYINYKNMCMIESIHDMTYDYIVKYRTDMVITKPVDFQWLFTSDDKVCGGDDAILSEVISNIFFAGHINHRTLGDGLALYVHKNDGLYNTVLLDTNIRSAASKYIQSGNYIITFRENLFYIVKRQYIDAIAHIGIMYGQLKTPYNNYWFNSESQFKEACYSSGLTIIDYGSVKEISSLYEYSYDNFFTANGDLADDNVLFFLMRY